MNKLLATVLILAVVIIGAAIYFFLPLRENVQNTVPREWIIYSNQNYDFTFYHPREADVGIENQSVKIVYLGEDAIPNSEITDGFSMYLSKREINGNLSIENFAQRQYEEATLTQESVTRPSLVAIGDKEGYEFEVRSLLDTVVTYNILEAEEGEVFLIIYSIADPEEDSGYQNMVNTIIRSLAVK